MPFGTKNVPMIIPHSSFVGEVSDLDMGSLYHHQTGEEMGVESVPTFFDTTKQGRPYHIDYAFLSNDLLAHARLELQDPKYWRRYSDHIPLVIDL